MDIIALQSYRPQVDVSFSSSHIIQLDIWLKLDDRFPDFMTKLNVIIVTKSLLALGAEQ